MKVFRRTAVHILLDHKRNEDIFEELKVETVDEKLRRYKSNWLRHATRTNSKRLPKIMLNYRSNIKKKLGRPLKRRLDQAETGLFKHDSWRMMMTMMTFKYEKNWHILFIHIAILKFRTPGDPSSNTVCVFVCVCMHVYIYIYIYRVFHGFRA